MSLKRTVVVATVVLAALSACSDRSWRGKDISSLMPALEFELTSETGEAVTEQVFAGRPVAIYFGFTHCPDICPTTLAKLVAAVRQLPEPLARRMQLAFVSVDPDRDTPRRLADYTAAFSDRMLGLSGTQRQLRSLTRRYRITYGYEDAREDGSYDVSHSSAILVFGAGGEARLMLLDSLSVAEIAADLERLLSEAAENANRP